MTISQRYELVLPCARERSERKKATRKRAGLALAVFHQLVVLLREVTDVDPVLLIDQLVRAGRSLARQRSTHFLHCPPLLSRSAYILPISPMPIKPITASDTGGSAGMVSFQRRGERRASGGKEETATEGGGSRRKARGESGVRVRSSEASAGASVRRSRGRGASPALTSTRSRANSTRQGPQR
jgi:hypothetical protein